VRRFSALYEELDTTTATGVKVAAMARYFREVPPADAAWAAYILSGRRLKRLIGPARLAAWLVTASGLPAWLVEETRAAVGDLAETIALLMESATPTASDDSLSRWIETALLPLRNASEEAQAQQVIDWWRTLPYRECFLVNKLLTGGLRVGVSQLLLTRALTEVTGIERALLTRRLMGDWTPSEHFWNSLVAAAGTALERSAPYPFCLASPLEAAPETLGARADWNAEWKWDGIRAQIVRRAGEVWIWSRGEELITERFPEVASAARALPDGCVLDGELLAWRGGAVQSFADLQQRIGRKNLNAAMLAKVPVRFLAYDLLEVGAEDIRDLELRTRRARLEQLLGRAEGVLGLSPIIADASWSGLERLRGEARARGVEGMMLKAAASRYLGGRVRGGWWKWKIEPHTVDAVMLYAHPGHGRRSNLYTDYTFAVWNGSNLVPVAKAYSGLTDVEILALDRWIRAHTRERFGPTRAVEPSQVFELAFEGIAASSRHKSGVALRFPRILRWRTDKPASEADQLHDLQRLLRVD
jgi:DNA ligase-1